MKTITLEAKIENIPVLTAFVDEQLEALDCPMKPQMQMDVAIDEVFTNIASYAYPGETGDAVITFDFDPEARMVSITFEDHGIPFDPMQREDPDVTLPAEQRAIGGLGIFLVKKTMDDMQYTRRDGANVLVIRKRI